MNLNKQITVSYDYNMKLMDKFYLSRKYRFKHEKHNKDIRMETINKISEQIALDIDREILNEIIGNKK